MLKLPLPALAQTWVLPRALAWVLPLLARVSLPALAQAWALPLLVRLLLTRPLLVSQPPPLAVALPEEPPQA
ncbi:MAG: hypothetical protein WCE23_12955, partial [Candidatus Binatus sp.]|uniref:hypothetical protein n=1 Tax=Candidatus Binatus sp. TaxID=2811406 RepID=UPI003C72ACC1